MARRYLAIRKFLYVKVTGQSRSGGKKNWLQLAVAADEQNDLYCDFWEAAGEATYSGLEVGQCPGCQKGESFLATREAGLD